MFNHQTGSCLIPGTLLVPSYNFTGNVLQFENGVDTYELRERVLLSVIFTSCNLGIDPRES